MEELNPRELNKLFEAGLKKNKLNINETYAPYFNASLFLVTGIVLYFYNIFDSALILLGASLGVSLQAIFLEIRDLKIFKDNMRFKDETKI